MKMEYLDRLRKHYQPIYGFEKEYIKKGKITQKRVEGYYDIMYIIHHSIMWKETPFARELGILDIGCNLGYFCFWFASLGCDVVGLDLDKRRIEICEEIKEKTGFICSPTFINENVLDWLRETIMTFDYVLLLNTFHHILVRDEEKGWWMFNKLLDRSKGIYVMMRSSYKGWKLKYPKNIPKSILEQSDANHFEALDRVHGRTIYFFSK